MFLVSSSPAHETRLQRRLLTRQRLPKRLYSTQKLPRQASSARSLQCIGSFWRKQPDSAQKEQVHLRDTYDPLPLHTALQPPNTNAERARELLRAHLDGRGLPFDVNAVDRDNRTALHFAAALGLAEVVEMLIKAGVDVNAQDSQGLTALHMACGYARPATVRALTDAACDFLRFELRDSRNRTAQQLVEELLAQEQPRKFGGLVRNAKYEAYSEILEIIKTHTNRTSS